MADSLKDFFIEIGFVVDEASKRKAEAAAAKTEAKLTEETVAALDQRRRAEDKAMADRVNAIVSVGAELNAEEKAAAARFIKTQADRSDADRKIQEEAHKKDRERREAIFKDLQKFALNVAAAMTGIVTAVGGTAAAIVAVVDKSAKSFEHLQYAAQRIGSSVEKMTAFAYGISQLGGSVDGANASLKAFGDNLNMNPQGFEAVLKSLGVRTRDAAGHLRDAADLAADAMASLQGKPLWEAKSDANQLGFDEDTMRAGRNPQFAGIVAQREADQQRIGLDPNKAGQESTGFEQSMRRLEATASDVGNKIKSDLFDKIKPLLDQLQEWIAAHGADIAKVAGDIADNLIKVATAITEHLKGINYDEIFGKKGGTDGMVPALEAAGVAVLALSSNFGGLLKAINLLSGTALPGWMLKLGLLNWLSAQPYLDKHGIENFDPATGQPYDAGGGNPMGNLGPAPDPNRKGWFADAWNWTKKKLGLAPSRGRARNKLGHIDDIPSGPAPGANGFGLIDAPYRASVDRKGEGGHLAPRELYDYLKANGASDNEALMLTSAAGSESSFNPNAVHDGGHGHGLWGHNDGRLDMRGKSWQQQAVAALAETRNRPEHGLLERAKTSEELADAEMHFEMPRGYTRRNPRGGDNYTGRLGTIRRFSSALGNASTPARSSEPPGVAAWGADSKGRPVPLDKNGQSIPWHRGMPPAPAAPAWSGLLDPRSLSNLPEMRPVAPLGITPAFMSTIDNSNTRGDTNINHSPTFHITSQGDASSTASAVRLAATRGQQDLLRNMQGMLT